MSFVIQKWGDELKTFVFIQVDGTLVSTDNPEATAEEASFWYTNQIK